MIPTWAAVLIPVLAGLGCVLLFGIGYVCGYDRARLDHQIGFIPRWFRITDDVTAWLRYRRDCTPRRWTRP